MKRYKNLSRNSGVTGYELGADFIRVRFQGGACYRYSQESAGRRAVKEMKRLAEEGRGLSTYISQQVRDGYAAEE